MAANVENMFYVREAPWHGLGTNVDESLNSKEALIEAGLNWKVVQRKIQTVDDHLISGYRANVREKDNAILGIVSDRYKVVQNSDAFSFTDALLGEGVKYETAGSLNGGKKVWLLAKLPREYKLLDDEVTPYLVFSNSHDGSGCIKVAMTPVRVVCQNTLNLALKSAKRSWSARHTGDIKNKLDEARNTLELAQQYMSRLETEALVLSDYSLSDKKVEKFIETLIPLTEDSTIAQVKNANTLRDQLRQRYYDAPDLQHVGRNAYRFVNAVSDFATHCEPLRKTQNYRENMFDKLIDGHPVIDRAYDLLRAGV